VSEEHSNFLINLGGGKAADVVMLASIIKQKVRDVLGVQLLEEVRYVGF
jgi:UDP-N-acetylmuramate dehydrogenase